MTNRFDRIGVTTFVIVGLLVLLAVLIAMSGCGGGLHWVPEGAPVPPGGKPIVTAILDGATEVDDAVGGWLQILGGAVGAGGIVAVGRKYLQGRRLRKTQTTALNEIVGGVQDFLGDNTPSSITLKRRLKEQASGETQDLVRTIKREIKRVAVPDTK